MNQRELICKIKANPILQELFGGGRRFNHFCPNCVEKALNHPNQEKVEATINALVSSSAKAEALESRIQELAGSLQEDLKKAHADYRRSILDLFEILKPAHSCGQDHGDSDTL